MSDSFAPTALFLDCNNLYHKLRASDEALACGYRGVAATPRLRVGGQRRLKTCVPGGGPVGRVGRRGDGAQVCNLRFDNKGNSLARRAQVGNLRSWGTSRRHVVGRRLETCVPGDGEWKKKWQGVVVSLPFVWGRAHVCACDSYRLFYIDLCHSCTPADEVETFCQTRF